MIRRKLVGSYNESSERSPRIPARNKILLSRQEKRALRSLRLVEKVESIGLENIMHASTISPLAIGSVRTRVASPMTQLTSLKNISRRSDDPYAVDKETIRAVLNKGLSHESLLTDTTTDFSTTSSITNPDDSSVLSANSEEYSVKPSSYVNFSAHARKAKSKPTETTKTPQKVKQMQKQKSRRSLINGGQRPDLGTVGPAGSKSVSKKNTFNNKIPNQSTKQLQELDSDEDGRSDVASVPPQQSYTQSFVGSISSLFFGRKGGLL